MKSEGIVVYKGIDKRDGGIFKNDKGQDINYDSSYVIKFDEISNGIINERRLKFPAKNTTLYNKFKDIESYTKVKLFCDVLINTSICKLVPNDVSLDLETED